MCRQFWLSTLSTNLSATLSHHSLHHIYSRLFSPFSTIMGWKEVAAEELLESAIANVYKQLLAPSNGNVSMD